MKRNKTYSTKPEDIKRESFVVNADSKVLGRMATVVARILWGKNKPIFSPHMDCGDTVYIYNAEKIRLTGAKEMQKTYFSHSGFIRGDKLLGFLEKKRRDPRKILYLAVKGMLPRNSLGEKILKKLRINTGQLPEEIKAKGFKEVNI
ncbi:MAG: large subunit ribosomal protein L13 [Candidatus Saganbacteria bacterium]|uniref:Large ribosomal subunit protein uL13 n=1 Tax=Candidatus Saganbacteria bacterium TaxID=2575572 RepID=A0A833L149_UNCSA|nr:MAG: large subunit ribosomal protein L13 [Candidatus Saganbacteria bacterium]